MNALKFSPTRYALVAALTASAALAGCAGGGGGPAASAIPQAGPASPTVTQPSSTVNLPQGSVRITLVIPQNQKPASAGRRLQFVSPATRTALVYIWYTGNPKPPQPNATINTNPVAGNCTATQVAGNPAYTCTATVTGPIGQDTIEIDTYDGSPTSLGNQLGATTSSLTISSQTAASTPTFNVNPIVSKVQFPDALNAGSAGSPGTLQESVLAYDADGYIITGAPTNNGVNPDVFSNPFPAFIAQGGSDNPSAISFNPSQAITTPGAPLSVIYNGAPLRYAQISTTPSLANPAPGFQGWFTPTPATQSIIQFPSRSNYVQYAVTNGVIWGADAGAQLINQLNVPALTQNAYNVSPYTPGGIAAVPTGSFAYATGSQFTSVTSCQTQNTLVIIAQPTNGGNRSTLTLTGVQGILGPITMGPSLSGTANGGLWFAINPLSTGVTACNNAMLGYVQLNADGSMSQTFQTFTLPEVQQRGNTSLADITLGPNGNIWYAEPTLNGVGFSQPQLACCGSTNLQSQGFMQAPSANAGPTGIVSGPLNDIWFTEPGVGKVVRVSNLSVFPNTMNEYATGLSNSSPEKITLAADGELWFTDISRNALGAISPLTLGPFPAYTINEYAGPSGYTAPTPIVSGSDKYLYFFERSAPATIRFAY